MNPYPTTSLFYKVLGNWDFTKHTPKGFFKSHQMTNVDMLSELHSFPVTLGSVNSVILLMLIQFAQINVFFEFVVIPKYYKEKSDMQSVLLKTLFTFGQIQISHLSSKKLSSILLLDFLLNPNLNP